MQIGCRTQSALPGGAREPCLRRGGDQFDKPPHASWITEQIASRRYSSAIGWNHAISPKTYYNLRASTAYYGRQTYFGSGMDPFAYGDTRNPLHVADAQLAHQSGRHTLLGGYQVAWEHVEDSAPSYGRTLGGTFRNQGLYLQDEWRASKSFILIGGARFDKSNRVDAWIVRPRVGAKYAFTENLVWRTTLSTGFRAPVIFDEDLHIAQVGGEGSLLQNSSYLKEEKSVSAGSGMQYLGTLRGRLYQTGFDVFYTELRDAFMLVEEAIAGQDFRRLLRTNGAGAHVAGISFDGNLQLSARLSFRGGFTFQQARWAEPESQFGARDFQTAALPEPPKRRRSLPTRPRQGAPSRFGLCLRTRRDASPPGRHRRVLGRKVTIIEPPWARKPFEESPGEALVPVDRQ